MLCTVLARDSDTTRDFTVSRQNSLSHDVQTAVGKYVEHMYGGGYYCTINWQINSVQTNAVQALSQRSEGIFFGVVEADFLYGAAAPNQTETLMLRGCFFFHAVAFNLCVWIRVRLIRRVLFG